MDPVDHLAPRLLKENTMRYFLALAICLFGLTACKEETKKTETTVQTDPASGEPATVEKKETTEEKQ